MANPPGVPNLLNTVAFLSVNGVLSADTFFGYGPGAQPLWGIFFGGTPIIAADTVTALAFEQNWAVADYPVERGGFESYDKVNNPARVRIQFVSGGSEEKRQALLDSIAAIGDQLALFDVVTPEAIYVGYNIDSYSYRRTSANGLGLMIVDVTMLEIREAGVTDYKNDFKNPASPSGFSPDPIGNVQSTTTTSQPVPQVT